MRPADVVVGEAIPALDVQTTPLQLFRYSAATWNSHKIHYDAAYAAEEGHPGILVHSHLHAAFLVRACTRWAGAGALRSLSYKVVRSATPADRLTVTGQVVDREEAPDGVRLRVELVERNAEGQACATGTATLQVTHAPVPPAAGAQEAAQ